MRKIILDNCQFNQFDYGLATYSSFGKLVLRIKYNIPVDIIKVNTRNIIEVTIDLVVI